MNFGFSKGPRALSAMVVAVIVAGAVAPAVAQVGVHHPAGGGHPGGGGHPHFAGGPGHRGPGGWHGGGGGGGHWQGGQWVVPGLALGILGAAAAAATYGQPPAPGMCWYYNDPSQTSGFWDYCH
jgi:hypothetical protein